MQFGEAHRLIVVDAVRTNFGRLPVAAGRISSNAAPGAAAAAAAGGPQAANGHIGAQYPQWVSSLAQQYMEQATYMDAEVSAAVKQNGPACDAPLFSLLPYPHSAACCNSGKALRCYHQPNH